jgi:transposase
MDTTGSGRRRRSWPEALKREVVAASLEPGASVSLVARRYDLNTNQLFSWRRRYRNGSQGVSGAAGPELLPVTVTDDCAGEPIASPPAGGDEVEIELPKGYRVRVAASIDVEALRRIVDMLERR